MTHVFMDWHEIEVGAERLAGGKAVLLSVVDASKKYRIWLKMKPKTAVAIGKCLIKAGQKARW